RGTLSLVGPGSVERFETGVRAEGEARLASVVAVRLAGHRLDGLVARGDGYSIQGSVAEGNGRDGFALAGSGYALDGNRASGNGRYGLELVGMGNHGVDNAGLMGPSGHGSEMMSTMMAPLVQCRIGMMGECR